MTNTRSMSLLLAVYCKSMILVHLLVGQSCLIKIYMLNNILKSTNFHMAPFLLVQIHEIGTTYTLMCNPCICHPNHCLVLIWWQINPLYYSRSAASKNHESLCRYIFPELRSRQQCNALSLKKDHFSYASIEAEARTMHGSF